MASSVAASIFNKASGIPSEDLTSAMAEVAPSIATLAGMATIPPQFQHLASAVAAYLNALQVDTRSEENERESDLSDFVDSAALARQREIDAHQVTLNIGGENIDMSQGDLRDVMTKRMETLKKQREDMARTGASADELRRVDGLIDQYEPLVESLEDEKADGTTIEAIQELAKQDPALAKNIQDFDIGHAVPLPSRSTSFAAINTPQEALQRNSLRDTFTREASPADPNERTPDRGIERDQPAPVAKSSLASMGL